MKEVILQIRVKLSNTISDIKVARLIDLLIKCGLEDASNTPDDFDNPDVDKVLALEIGDVTVIGHRDPDGVEEPVGE